MASQNLVVYLLTESDIYEGELSIVFGPIPTRSALTLKLHGPVIVRLPRLTYHKQESPKPIYDYKKDQIIMLMEQGSWDDDTKIKNVVDILRFGKNLDLQSSDRMTRKFEGNGGWRGLDATSAIIEAETGLLSLNCSELISRGLDAMRTIIVQKRPDPQNPDAEIWNESRLTIPSKDTTDIRNNLNTVMLNGAYQSSNKTVYNLSVPFVDQTSPDHEKKRICLHTLPSNIFNQLYKDKSIVWRRCNIATEYEPWRRNAAYRLCPILTYDSTNDKHRLYIFQIITGVSSTNTYESRIWVTQIDLRKDGSVPGFGEDIKPAACWSVLASEHGGAEALCVLQDKYSVLVSWNDGSRGPVARLLPFNSATGEIDRTKEWTKVPIEFESKEKATSVSASGVVVPNDFIED